MRPSLEARKTLNYAIRSYSTGTEAGREVVYTDKQVAQKQMGNLAKTTRYKYRILYCLLVPSTDLNISGKTMGKRYHIFVNTQVRFVI